MKANARMLALLNATMAQAARRDRGHLDVPDQSSELEAVAEADAEEIGLTSTVSTSLPSTLRSVFRLTYFTSTLKTTARAMSTSTPSLATQPKLVERSSSSPQAGEAGVSSTPVLS